MKRLTIDADTKSHLRLIWNLYRCFKHVRNIIKIEIEPSFNKKWHIIIWYKSKQSLRQLRYKLEMDKRRLIYDYDLKERPKQILFIEKGKWKKCHG